MRGAPVASSARRSAAVTPEASIDTASRGRGLGLIAAGAAVTIAVAGAAYSVWHGNGEAVVSPPGAVQSAPTLIESRLELAERSMLARDYRDARSYANDVLAAAPDHARARAIRDEADGLITRADAALDERAGADRYGRRSWRRSRPGRGAFDRRERTGSRRGHRVDGRALQGTGRGRAARTGANARRRGIAFSIGLNVFANHTTDFSTAGGHAAADHSCSRSTSTVSAARAASDRAGDATATGVTAARTAADRDSTSAETAAAAVPVNESKPAAESDDDAVIRSVVASYARAIESKDLVLFRSLKPNMAADEERRIQQGFRAVTSQKVNVTILSIDRRGDRATVQLKRQDVIEAAAATGVGEPTNHDHGQTATDVGSSSRLDGK